MPSCPFDGSLPPLDSTFGTAGFGAAGFGGGFGVAGFGAAGFACGWVGFGGGAAAAGLSSLGLAGHVSSTDAAGGAGAALFPCHVHRSEAFRKSVPQRIVWAAEQTPHHERTYSDNKQYDDG